MKKATLLFLPLFLAFSYLGIQQWKLDDAYRVKFSSPDVSGHFKTMKAEIAFDEKDLKHSYFKVQVAVNSLETGNPGMNETATGGDMFDSKNFPQIQFNSNIVEKTDTAFIAKGTLEMHGIKKEIRLPFSFHKNTFTGGFAVACSAYGMKGAGKGASDTVRVVLTVPVK